MSFVAKTRPAKTIGKGRLCLSMKLQEIDIDETLGPDGEYHDLVDNDTFERWKGALSLKYGWARHHHLCITVPYVINDVEVGRTDIRTNGLSNVSIFKKWNCIQETKWIPAVAVDAGRRPEENTNTCLGHP